MSSYRPRGDVSRISYRQVPPCPALATWAGGRATLRVSRLLEKVPCGTSNASAPFAVDIGNILWLHLLQLEVNRDG